MAKVKHTASPRDLFASAAQAYDGARHSPEALIRVQEIVEGLTKRAGVRAVEAAAAEEPDGRARVH